MCTSNNNCTQFIRLNLYEIRFTFNIDSQAWIMCKGTLLIRSIIIIGSVNINCRVKIDEFMVFILFLLLFFGSFYSASTSGAARAQYGFGRCGKLEGEWALSARTIIRRYSQLNAFMYCSRRIKCIFVNNRNETKKWVTFIKFFQRALFSIHFQWALSYLLHFNTQAEIQSQRLMITKPIHEAAAQLNSVFFFRFHLWFVPVCLFP